MDADADPGEAARALNAARWSPEGRVKAGVAAVAAHPELLDEAQRAALEAAITEESRDE
jgi:hypothetical protein